MSDEAKPAYLRGRGSRGRGTACPPETGDRSKQRPGRRNKGWRNQDASSVDNRLSQDSATSGNHFGGNMCMKLELVQNSTT